LFVTTFTSATFKMTWLRDRSKLLAAGVGVTLMFSES